jgi:ribonuclease E
VRREVARGAASSAAPALLHGEADFVTRAVRELAVRSPEGTGGALRVVTDHADAAAAARRALGASAAEVEVEVHASASPLFHVNGVERAVRQLDEPRVLLPGGASLVIHETEAMWTIDVNSGRLRSGDTPEANALETDLLAAREAARQIRLRDLPGLVVIDFIDFIDCREAANRARVEETLRAELAKDPARMRVAPLSEFMVAEITRRRLRSGPARSGASTCRTCRGRGRVLSPAAVGLAALREVRALLADGAPRGVLVVCPPEVADDLARRREDLEELRRRHSVPVDVRSSTSLEGDRFEVRRL